MGQGVTARSLVSSVRLHPRVSYQGALPEGPERDRLLDRMPSLVPFRRSYHSAFALVDWDHRLPSRHLTIRLHVYYDAATSMRGEASFEARLREIRERDRFPEFDVPDFQDLPADETYETVLDQDGLSPWRLTSTWRRDIQPDDARAAIEVARASSEYEKVASLTSPRPRYLGDLDAVSWTPPCESNHPHWTLDVWYLLAFDGRVGSGRSFLVDLQDRQVVTARDFSVRTG